MIFFLFSFKHKHFSEDDACDETENVDDYLNPASFL